MSIYAGTKCLVPRLEQEQMPTGYSLSSQMGSHLILTTIPLLQRMLTETKSSDMLLGYVVAQVSISIKSFSLFT